MSGCNRCGRGPDAPITYLCALCSTMDRAEKAERERDEARATAYNLREILDDVLQGTTPAAMVEVGGLPWEPEDWRRADTEDTRTHVSDDK